LHQGKNCGEAQFLAEWATYGNTSDAASLPIPGVTQCLIVWGANQAVSGGKRIVKRIAALQEQGGKLIVVDPRRTEISEMADQWLRLRPGTDGALAYGMLNVIIREKLYDATFVENWCQGFDLLAKTVEPFTPERTAEITWLTPQQIVDAARTFATCRPGLIPFGLGVVELGKATNSAVFGICYLRAITGNLDVKGGQRLHDMPELTRYREELYWDRMLEHPLRTRDNVSAHLWPIASARGMQTFREAMSKVNPLGPGAAIYMMCVAPQCLWNAILDEDPYPIKGLITQGTNALVALANSRRIHQALLSDKLELSVNMDHWMTPGAQLADYVLPATDGLERPLLGAMWGFGNSYEAANRIVQPRYERRDDYQLWRELGNRTGQEGYWPDTLEGWFDRLLEPSGMTHAELAAQPVPWVTAKGGYQRHEKVGFATASGKVELASDLMVKLGYPAIPPYEEPAWSPASTPELFAEYPLIMTSGGGAKWYYRSQQRQLAKMRKQHPYAELTVHPETAAGLGIVEDAMVWVETPLGRIRQVAKFSDALHPKVVHADGSWWYPEQSSDPDTLYGVWESNINSILPDSPETADFAGDCNFRGSICRVYPATEGNPEVSD
jgi:anaerobic selenocysteine-containing dehydrogenase